MIKIVAIDLDGTLFDPKKIVSEENRLALKRCKELGCKVVLATGRPIPGVMPLLQDLGLTSNDDYVIVYNGTKVLNVGTGEVIFSSTISGKTVKEIYKESQRLDVDFHAFRKNKELITPRHNPWTDIEATLNHVEDILFDINDVNDDEEFLKAMIVASEENLTKAISKVNPELIDKYSMVRSSRIFLEFLNKNSDKGKALKALADHLGIDIKDTMAIGDAGNDLPMIKAAGIGVAMENAFPEVKEGADFITLSNKESGVAYAINKFILNK